MPLTQSERLLQELVKRVEALIVVLLETARPNGKPLPVKDRVRILSAAGLRPTEIAGLLRITPQNVSVVLYEIRKEKRPKPKPKLLPPITAPQPSNPVQKGNDPTSNNATA
jgi:hypothetical protein